MKNCRVINTGNLRTQLFYRLEDAKIASIGKQRRAFRRSQYAYAGERSKRTAQVNRTVTDRSGTV